MKFSIRDILWLTILAAALVAWWLDHRANSRIHERLQQQALQLRRELFNEHREVVRAKVAAVDERVKALTAKVRSAQLEAASLESK
jgi:hypothetical protein